MPSLNFIYECRNCGARFTSNISTGCAPQKFELLAYEMWSRMQLSKGNDMHFGRSNTDGHPGMFELHTCHKDLPIRGVADFIRFEMKE